METVTTAASAHSYQQTIRQAIEAQNAGQVKPGSMLDRLCLYYRWIEARQCIIRDIHSEQIPLVLNRPQMMLFAKMLEQAIADLPIRGVVLKARKEGISTFVQSLMFFLSATYGNQVASMLAHSTSSTVEIFQIARLMATNNPYGDGRPSLQAIHFDKNGSRYYCRTAGGEGVGAGGTPSLLHLSEVALWVMKKEETEYTATTAVPYVPNTMIVYESTARGRELFYERFEAARRGESSYFALFLPWFLNTDCRMDISQPLEREPEEQALVALARDEYGMELSDEQLGWRRLKLAELGPAVFRQEFPSTPEEAVQARKGLVLPHLLSCVTNELPFAIESVNLEGRVGGMDYGYRDATVLITACYVDQVLYIIDVYHRVGGLARDHVQALQDTWTYYCDPSALQGRRELEEEADSIRDFEVSLLPAPRRKQIRERDYAPHEFANINRLAAEGRLKILYDAAERIIMEAEHLAWNDTTGQPDMKRGEPWGHFDTLDALRYLVMGISQSTQADIKIGVTPRMTRRASLRAL